MFRRYRLFAYFEDQVIYKRSFYSFNHLIKVCTGFDTSIEFEVEDLVSDQMIPNSTITDLVDDFKNDYQEDF